jgi:uncharacterized protein (DUF305 family)
MPFAVMIFGLIFFSCKKDDSGIQLQAHDNNRIMDSMHVMMDRMNAMQKTNDPELDFPSMMILHHQGAIGMARVELENGSSDTLKSIALKMTKMQEIEIQELQSILSEQAQNNSVMEFSTEQMNHMEKMDQMADIQVITGDIDNDFATLMIFHHNSAIENAEAYLLYGTDNDLKEMAKKMIDDQKAEIQVLSEWLKANKR